VAAGVDQHPGRVADRGLGQVGQLTGDRHSLNSARTLADPLGFG
jgi:hypothetical protein